MSSAPPLSTAAVRPAVAWPAVLAAAILVAACAARLFGLEDLVVWHDEVSSLIRVFGHSYVDVHRAAFEGDPWVTRAGLLAFQSPDPAHGWDDTLRALVGHPEHPPLYYLLARLAATLAGPYGISPVAAARGVSALAGILAVPAAYWLTRELFGRGPAPWVAALLVACSPLQFLYAQEARQYTLWILAVAASSAALLRALRLGGASWWTYGALVALGLNSHLLFVLTVAVQGAYAAIAGKGASLRERARPWVLAAGVGSLAFLPWLAVLLTHHQDAAHFTDWMAMPIGRLNSVLEWGTHLTRLFVDFGSSVRGGSPWLLIPLGLALAFALLRAPRPALWLPVGIAAVYVAVVLGPDLVFGGSRSQHIRYALPAVLAVQVLLAWVIGAGLVSGTRALRYGSGAALAVVLLAGGLSIAAIARADTWWSKQFSATNGQVARLLSQAERPLLIVGDSDISSGELISTVHRLDERVPVWTERHDLPPPVAGRTEILVLMPSSALRERLGNAYRWEQIPGTWQWWRIEQVDSAPDRRLGAPTEQASE